ncbi:MAG: quinolinate synthase NadA [Planctomycetota bacterium]
MHPLTENEMIERINDLRERKNAVILAHNYQLGEVQDIADVVGDSLELSFRARDTDARMIISCGVTFMAETQCLLAPGKTVLQPVAAGCPMADMCDVEGLRALKKAHPGAWVVCYINSTAAVKAESDICVTSANAVNIVSRLSADREVIFVPDENLGAYVRAQTGRDMIAWPGYCPVHNRITPEAVRRCRAEYPDAVVVAHPEARPEVVAMADEVLSTGGMIRFSRTTPAGCIIVATEIGLIYRLRRENPGKRFIAVSEQAVCPDMKMHRLADVLAALENGRHAVTVSEAIRRDALRPVEKMLAMAS